ncbi:MULTISPECIES: KpsF/GutQ family sugar-phosphate isomerase [unclassified Candidatus Frackibacter]|uniref:KpsF/GutQ family sugar-phosphate isomerase n=1 Tax=unclassified Candidatus Frackibacter TaxID=2648818 RepID=UPI00088253AF|nr:MULTISPECIES: KpsF/GutQ family sugar-phosphate isomerase [unclassified Candidatus Frackibacter]SDC09311.1 arabinose-5-phosphate isomerase [Candidatus Frackibacter sp. WG11]SEM37853.1 arabinose-5-phosphate isomerase [Candidatus Frackibacter sp. WG12]SFL43310.1 arabinose-5-phosphate isomerase [Candidatus Frackibacter sp. WG13]
MNDKEIKARARRVLDIEAEAITNLRDSINGTFAELVEVILACSGRVIMTGMGKSGLIAKKLAATLSSTGTPSFFLHPGEAIHGDLGMVTEKDIVIALSNSGETKEVIQILPIIKRIGAEIIALTGGVDSTLAENADYFLDTSVEREACPLDLAPTASTTATLALGDALAVSLLEARGFQPEDFALYHPGGSLGKKLLLKVEDVMHVRERNPLVEQDKPLKEALFTMTSTQMGAANIIDENGKLIGIITDGDVRRQLEESSDPLRLPTKEVMTAAPTTITADKLAVEAVKIMQDKEISDLPVVDKDHKPLGMVNFQDLLKAGVF